MNKIITTLLVLTLLSIFNLNAQELKKRTRTESGTIETYHVLKSDKKIKHGDYEKKTNWGQLVIQGKYDQNMRKGLWSFYDYRTGLLEQQYDYDKNEFIFLNSENSKLNHLQYNGEWIMAELDSVPIVIGGLSNLRLELIQTAYSHTKAPKFPKAGTAIFSFIITSGGLTRDYKISQSSGNTFEKYLLKVIQEYPGQWIPGVYKGEQVDVEFILPMNIIYQESNALSKQYSIDFNYPEIVIKTVVDNR